MGAVEAINAKDRHVVAAMVAEATIVVSYDRVLRCQINGRSWSWKRSTAMPSPGACGERHQLT